MKHTHEEYIKFCDREIAKRKRIYKGLIRPIPDQLESYHDVGIASLLANKATLERHEPKESGNYFSPDYEVYCQDGCNEFPCPTLLGVTNQLDLVMEVM